MSHTNKKAKRYFVWGANGLLINAELAVFWCDQYHNERDRYYELSLIFRGLVEEKKALKAELSRLKED